MEMPFFGNQHIYDIIKYETAFHYIVYTLFFKLDNLTLTQGMTHFLIIIRVWRFRSTVPHKICMSKLVRLMRRTRIPSILLPFNRIELYSMTFAFINGLKWKFSIFLASKLCNNCSIRHVLVPSTRQSLSFTMPMPSYSISRSLSPLIYSFICNLTCAHLFSSQACDRGTIL